MCKGAEEGHHGGFRPSSVAGNCVSSDAAEGSVLCELCRARASLYCQADDAYLCRTCDKWVHGANFLALRHVRCILCHTCQNLTQKYLIGASTKVLLPTIVSCREADECNSSLDNCCSVMLKRPFLFL